MSTETNKINSWPDLAIGLYDRLTERNAVISYDFEDFAIQVPQRVASDRKTEWKMNGKLTITTSEKDN